MKRMSFILFLSIFIFVGCKSQTNFSNLQVETKQFRLEVDYPSIIKKDSSSIIKCNLTYLGDKTATLEYGENLIEVVIQDEQGNFVYGKLSD